MVSERIDEHFSERELVDADRGLTDLAIKSLSLVNDERMKNASGDREDDNGNVDDGRDEDDEEDVDDDYKEDFKDDYDDEEDVDDDYEDYEDDRYYSEEEEKEFSDERLDFKEDKMVLQEIQLPEYILERYSFIKDLPLGIAVMGGTARSIAREIITGEREPIRDIDLVNILRPDGTSLNDYATINVLSLKYMPDDYQFGHGIQSETMKHYFDSRDFTINQCLIYDGKLIVSNFAYNDFEENIIRPTYYEHRFSRYKLGSRMFLKALLMRSVISRISSSIPTLEDVKCPNSVYPFDIALFLNKAMSRGAGTARTFAGDLAEWDLIPDEYAGKPMKLAKYLLGEVYDFEFRPSTDERFVDIQECDDMGGYFLPSSMLKYHGGDPVIRDALSEYEDDEALIAVDGERMDGRYTESDYDAINRAF